MFEVEPKFLITLNGDAVAFVWRSEAKSYTVIGTCWYESVSITFTDKDFDSQASNLPIALVSAIKDAIERLLTF